VNWHRLPSYGASGPVESAEWDTVTAYAAWVRVTTTDGRALRIGRRWLPWRPRPRDFSGVDIGMPGDDLGGVGLSIVLGIVPMLLAPVILLVLVLTGEVVVAIALLPLAVLTRVLLRRPWLVEVRQHRHLLHSEKVVGWRPSGQRIRELAHDASYLPT